MNVCRCCLSLILCCAVITTVPVSLAQTAQGTAFTYQGELDQNGVPVTANADIVFALFDAAIGGNAVGSPLNFTAANGNPVAVQNGIFTVALDFGALAFAGAVSDERYLSVTVNGNPLSPRTKIENAPYALQARTAELAYSVSNASIGSAQIVPAQVQQRVGGNCAVGSSMRSIAQDGTVTCQAGGNGTVTSVSSGTGLTGGPITGSGTLGIANAGVGLAQIDSTQVQARVTGSCSAGQKVLGINADGTVMCATDATGGAGTVTSVGAGTGLTGGPVTASGTLSIANGGVGLAQINASQVQVRIGGTCALGEYVRGINTDGSVVCSPAPGVPRITSLDTLGNVGVFSAIAIGINGLPVISYYDVNNRDLKIAHCANTACTAATLTSVDTAGDVGLDTAIAIGADQLPVVSYIDNTNFALKVAHCANAVCTTATITLVDAVYPNPEKTGIAIGADDLPVVSYYGSGTNLKVAHCANAACTGGATITVVDTTSFSGTSSAIAIGADGLPVVSYLDGNSHLKVAHCANAVCAGAATITVVDSAGNVGAYTSIAIGADGLPVVSYYDNTNFALKVAHCANAACTGAATITTVDTAGQVGRYTSIAIGADGLPVVSYYDSTYFDLKVAHCANAACTGTATITAVDTAGEEGGYTSIAIGEDGLPIVSYYEATASTPGTDDLKIVKCNNRFCQ